MDTPSRRSVLASATLATLAASTATAAEPSPANKDNPMPEIYELRTFRLRRGPMPARFDPYLKDGFIPAARRAGAGPIGVFNVTIGTGNPSLYVLIPHPTIESFLTLPEKLSNDQGYKSAAADFRALPATDPPYHNFEVQLLKAFPHFPKLEVPENKPRIFELRSYRSHNRSALMKKIEMFDTAGEIAIFRRVGLTPVFFAQTLTGDNLPSLTYLLTFPDLATREKNFATFRADPEWEKLRNTPGFTDAEIVTDINNQILAPTAYSQI